MAAWNNLPEDLLWTIFDQLDMKSLVACSGVCYAWRQSARRHPHWAVFLRDRYYFPSRREEEVAQARRLDRSGEDASRHPAAAHPFLRGREIVTLSSDPVVGPATAAAVVQGMQEKTVDLASPTLQDLFLELKARENQLYAEAVLDSDPLDASGNDSEATAMALLPSRGLLLVGYQSGRVRAFTLKGMKPVGSLLASHDYEVNAIATDDVNLLVTAGDDAMVLVWSMAGEDIGLWRVVRSIRCADRVKDISLDPRNDCVYACTHTRGLFCFDLSAPADEKVDLGESYATKARWGFQNTLGKRSSVALLAGSVYLGQQNGIAVADAATGRVTAELTHQRFRSVSAMATSGALVLGAGTRNAGIIGIDTRFQVTAASVQTPVHFTQGMKSSFRSIATSPCDPWLVATGGACVTSNPDTVTPVSPVVNLWDMRYGGRGPFAEIIGHRAVSQSFRGIEGICITGDSLYSCGVDATVRYFHWPSLEEVSRSRNVLRSVEPTRNITSPKVVVKRRGTKEGKNKGCTAS